jgi:hypothetical protein
MAKWDDDPDVDEASDDFLRKHVRGLAQLETAGGRKTIKGPKGEDSHNLYNIKGKGFRARDRAEGSNDEYRTYASPEESTEDVVRLIKARYPRAAAATTPEEFAAGLKGYATDPAHGTKLVSTFRGLPPPKPARWDSDPDLGPAVQPAGAPPPKPETGFLADAGAAIRGYGEGLSAGLVKYPQALLRTYNPFDALLGGGGAGQTGTFAENLAQTRAENAAMAAEQPKSWYGGQVGGALTGGILTGGGSVPVQAAKGAAMGGAAGFSANPYTNLGDLAADTGGGAAVGGTIAGGSALLSKGAGAILDRVVKRNTIKGLEQSIDRGREALKAVESDAKKGLVRPPPPAPLNPYYVKGDPSTRIPAHIALREAAKNATKSEAATIAEDVLYLKDRLAAAKKAPPKAFRDPTSKSLGGEPRGSPEPMTNLAWLRDVRGPKYTSRLQENLVAGGIGSLAGAATGAGSALMYGGNPLHGALIGSGIGGSLGALGGAYGAQLGMNYGPGVSSALGAAGRAAIPAVGPAAESLRAPPVAFRSYDEYLAQFEAAQTDEEKQALNAAWNAQAGR